MIRRLWAWLRFDDEVLAAAGQALAAFSGICVPYDQLEAPAATKEPGHRTVATTVGG